MKSAGRRKLLLAGGAAVLAPFTAAGQEQKLRRIGFVSPTAPGARDKAFVQGLQERGHIHGRTVDLQMRFADGQPERLGGLIEELIRLKVDVLVVGATIGARAAKKATATIPIVFAGSSDPVAGGIVTNLARPGGNITGFSLAYGGGFAGKWLELLKETVPDLARAAVLWSSTNAAASGFVDEVKAAAERTGVGLDVHHAANLAELERELAAIGAGPARGLIVIPSPFAATQRRRLVQFAAERKLAGVYFSEDFPRAGGLMSYGPSIPDTYRRAASHVDKILRGTRPGDLPVEQPTRFELVINAKAAGALGLKIPRSVLLRADEIIE